MKKIKMGFSFLALLLAITAVFAREFSSMATVYYISSFPGANCDYEYYYPVCAEGDGPQCMYASVEGIMYISIRNNGGPCTVYQSYY